ncbi:sulfatase-like hydrolase/transferase [Pseudomonas mosselii]|uniref:Sulfatase-like hydrolase/transferase n=1 Tax=Pseudomonas mosselii TaxID=78327 RepID=A0ABX9B9Z5_9PSED|nr:sulfatase-like hydrolase/transferase [Pseudomonas mosselii]KXG81347.1 sulfatase [Pseudomonas mosselii]MBS9759657.1 sulfatase-like hydrolase/transferase [Pseudomonas mosselii]MDH0630015.1 sulfatase-like hydrolase/transferase [Pseudomonas mosselii]MDH0676155.1 sulfatase-like hydrolase/transferase [Pseudomonas mosselii]MDH0923861.1 sulfatase-like hydrolase/transferase [Pseudomonas mosselii]
MRGWIKLLLLLVYLASFHAYYRERIEALGIGLPLVLYLGVFALLALALLLTAFTRPGWLRWALALAFTISAIFLDAYNRITDAYLTYSAFVSMVYAGAFVQEALQQYHYAITLAAARALLLLFGLGLRPGPTPWLPRLLPPVAPVLGLLVLIAILFVRAGEGARGLPVMYTPLAYLSLFGYETLHDHVGPRQPVSLAQSGPAMARDIVLLIDESISGNYLDLNTPAGVTSHLAQAQPGVSIVNFGYAASIANCSADTNVTLRYGGTRGDYLRINSTQPSIWQYAKRAGLGTVYIDGQRTGGNLQNLMTETEKRDIDQFIQFDDTPVVQRDMAALERLVALLKDGKPQLIVVNKVGAHFPVHDKYPDDFLKYQPALPRGRYVDIADTGTRDGFDGRAQDWVLYRNAYQNTVLWNVGEFFRRLFAEGDLSQAVVLYTSDHGQDLHERGNPGLNTHCDSDPVPEEGLVPLVVIQGEGLRTLDWQAHLPANRNASSHYNLFPTLLKLMGYDGTAVSALYGRSLDMPTDDPFTFNVRFNARLGAKPDFRHIDLGQVVTPASVLAGQPMPVGKAD